MATPVRRSLRIAKLAEAPSPIAAPMAAPIKKTSKPKAVALSAERMASIAAVKAENEAGNAIRAAYLAGDRSTPTLLEIQQVAESVTDLKAKIVAAKTVDDFKACKIAADGLFVKAHKIIWADPMGTLFLSDTNRYCLEAIEWIEWAAANPELAKFTPDDDEYWAISRPRGSTESVLGARDSALRTIECFERSMF